jgi:hypothetical protein
MLMSSPLARSSRRRRAALTHEGRHASRRAAVDHCETDVELGLPFALSVFEQCRTVGLRRWDDHVPGADRAVAR